MNGPEEMFYENWKKQQIRIFESRRINGIDWNEIDLEEKLFRLIVAINDLVTSRDELRKKIENRIKKNEDLIAKQQKQINMLIREFHPDADYIKELLGLDN